MSLQILTGAARTGKTYELYTRMIKSSMEHPGRRHIVLVPEQFTMQTQRTLVEMHPNHVIMNMEVMSFDWLARTVLEEQGKSYRILDDSGKSMLLRKSAGNHKKELEFFRRNLTKAGFINRMKSMLSELYQYGVTPEELEGVRENAEAYPILQAKMKDIQVFYRAFEEVRGKEDITAEELPKLLLKELPDSPYLKGAVIALDGFTGFTPIQYQLLEVMVKQAEMVGITLTLPETETLEDEILPFELFAMSKQTGNRLLRLGKTAGVKVELYTCNSRNIPVSKPAELEHLEKHFLRYGKHSRYTEDTQAIVLTSAGNPKEEAAAAVHRIHQLIRVEGYRYREIAVITGDLEGYRPFLTERLNREGIPYFIDQKKGVMQNPLVVLIRSAMEAVEKSFSYESMFRYLKCGLTGLPREAVDELENYVLATGRSSVRAWQSSWDKTYPGHENIDFEKLNAWREQAAGPLLILREKLKEEPRQVKKAIEALRELMETCQVDRQLENLATRMEAMEDFLRAEEFRKIHDCVEELFVQAEMLLGEESLSVTELGDVLDAGFCEARIGSIPSYMDQVQVGDIERSRLKDIKALILLGLNDGIVPKPAAVGGILTDEERDILKEFHIELAPTARENGCEEQFYLYTLLTKPTKRLYISYSKLSSAGESLSPSWYVGQLRRIFPNLRILDYPSEEPVIDSFATALDALAETIGMLREKDPDNRFKELYLLLKEEPAYQKQLAQILDGCFFRYPGSSISKAVAKMLYGDSLSGSVTRLEQYAACAYGQFLSHGLRLAERAEYELNPMDRGNFFHKALETVFHTMKEQGISPKTITEDVRKELVHQAVLEAAARGGDVLESSAKNEYFVKRWERMTDRTVWAICRQLSQSDFLPESFELKFDGSKSAAMNLVLDEDDRMYLKGVVDRLDICEDDTRVYVRVVDYKTGSTKLDLGSVYYGLQLQLLVYMDAVMETQQRQHPDKEIIPAGVYYYNIQDPLVETDVLLGKEDMEEKLLKSLRMQGLTNSGNLVKEHTEKTAGTEVTPEEFRSIINHVRKKVREFGKGILSGSIPAQPYRKGSANSCEYCAFSSVCGFDTRLPGYRYRRLKNLKPDDVLQWMEEEAEDGSQMDSETTGNH